MSATPYNQRVAFTIVTVFLLVAATTTLILWLVYRPSKPRISVVGGAIYDMNTTVTSMITTIMQFTVSIHNPNKRVAVYYDRLVVFVSYRDQAITERVQVPPLFEGKHATVAVSPMLGGGAVTVADEVWSGIIREEELGVVELRLVLMGRLRWKVGRLKTRHHTMYVTCDMLIGFKRGYVGQVPLLGSPDCNVNI